MFAGFRLEMQPFSKQWIWSPVMDRRCSSAVSSWLDLVPLIMAQQGMELDSDLIWTVPQEMASNGLVSSHLDLVPLVVVDDVVSIIILRALSVALNLKELLFFLK